MRRALVLIVVLMCGVYFVSLARDFTRGSYYSYPTNYPTNEAVYGYASYESYYSSTESSVESYPSYYPYDTATYEPNEINATEAVNSTVRGDDYTITASSAETSVVTRDATVEVVGNNATVETDKGTVISTSTYESRIRTSTVEVLINRLKRISMINRRGSAEVVVSSNEVRVNTVKKSLILKKLFTRRRSIAVTGGKKFVGVTTNRLATVAVGVNPIVRRNRRNRRSIVPTLVKKFVKTPRGLVKATGEMKVTHENVIGRVKTSRKNLRSVIRQKLIMQKRLISKMRNMPAATGERVLPYPTKRAVRFPGQTKVPAAALPKALPVVAPTTLPTLPGIPTVPTPSVPTFKSNARFIPGYRNFRGVRPISSK